MSTETVLAPQEVRDGNRILRFLGTRVAEADSSRPGVQRWSEMVVYRTAGGTWICQRIGHSTVAHRPDCRHVNHRMPSWLDAHEEARVRRTACLECQPAVGDSMDPHTLLESQRYSVLQAANYDELIAMLTAGRSREQVPPVISKLLAKIDPN